MAHIRWQKTSETTKKRREKQQEEKAGWMEYLNRKKKPADPWGSTEKASNNCGVGAGTSYPPCATAD